MTWDDRQTPISMTWNSVPHRPMSEPFRDALAAALDVAMDCWFGPVSDGMSAATRRAIRDETIAALPPEWRDYLAAREPLLALVAAAADVDTWFRRYETDPAVAVWLTAALADPAIVKLREAGRG